MLRRAHRVAMHVVVVLDRMRPSATTRKESSAIAKRLKGKMFSPCFGP